MLVGITGRAQHGKDTIAAALTAVHDYEKYAFADQLKVLALLANPYVYVLDKEAPNLDWYVARRMVTAGFWSLRNLVEEYGWEKAKTIQDVRRYLQELGTGVRNVIGADAWVRALEEKMLADGWPHNSVVSDVRFPNEEEWVHRHNGILIRVTRPDFDSGVSPDHESETHVPHLKADIDLVNSGSIQELQYKALTAIDLAVSL